MVYLEKTYLAFCWNLKTESIEVKKAIQKKKKKKKAMWDLQIVLMLKKK